MTDWLDLGYAAPAKKTFLSLIKYLRPEKDHLARQKSLFMSGEVRNPTFRYDRFEAFEIDNLLPHFDTFELPDNAARPLYEAAVDRRRKIVELASSARAGDMELFMDLSRQLKFVPDSYYTPYLVQNLTDRVEAARSSAGERLLRVLPPGNGDTLLPDEHVLAVGLVAMRQLCDSMALGTPPDGDVIWVAEDFKRAADASIAERGMVGCSAVIGNYAALSVSGLQLNIPQNLRMAVSRGFPVLAHELSHLSCNYFGQQSGWYLLHDGTPNNFWSGEGKATLIEQALRGHVTRYAGEENFLALSMAAGLHDGDPFDFNRVFHAMVDYYTFLRDEDDPSMRRQKEPLDLAWDRCVRIFKGTDCQAGHYFGKDVCYLPGNLEQWGFIRNNPEGWRLYQLGAFNPARPDEVAMLTEAGMITP